ncbi:YlbL family protein [Actinomyces faecalis]|uniref:YlbL family protein n=1 Tax=Actinomyces faecalis TaxID=2722820 RepID=UPI001FD089C7|nr:S16 family serine protease [Actinomyces faecalis]
MVAVTSHLTSLDGARPAGSDRSPRHRPRRMRWWVSCLVLAVVIAVAGATVPVNAVIESPGPTWNVLGSADQEGAGTSGQADDVGATAVIAVEGTQTYPAAGALRMTTVAVRGCPGYPVTTFDLITAWLSPEQTVVDREAVCPSSMSAEEVEQANQAQMTSSEQAAVVAALLESGEASRTILTVQGTADEQKGADVRPGDVLVSLTREDAATTTIDTFSQLRQLMSTIAPGTSVTIGLERDGQPSETSLTTIAPSDDDGDGTPDSTGSLLGLMLQVIADSPVTASFGLQDVGGPSAGMMFALGIIDSITPGDLTGGQDVAGTGTISVDGAVGPIGGIAQKMAGAKSAGSSFFLAPADNCAEVVGHEPDGMQVYAVSTLHEAVQAVEAIAAGDTSPLTSCQSVLKQ